MRIKPIVTTIVATLTLIVSLGFTGHYLYKCYNENIQAQMMEIAKKSHEAGYKQGYKEAETKLIGLLEKDFENFRTELITYYNKETFPIKEYLLVDKRIEKIISISNPKMSQEKMAEYKTYIRKWAGEYELDPVFIAAMIHRESNFKENAVSKAGAKGPCQVIYKWWKPQCDKLGITEKDLHSINHGINIGCQAFKIYLVKANGDYRKALKLYNGDKSKKDSPYVRDILRITMEAYAVTA